jgi:MerR family transcriptional regulator, redox-sensitive transcriptional activator SoxR
MRAAVLSVGQVSQRSGVAISALHYYEALGLIRSIRTAGNQRRYRRDVLRHIAVIRAAQRIGIPLQEIREALALLPDARSPTRADWTRLSSNWRQALNTRIEQLTALRDQLDSCIGCGCLSLKRCKLSNPDDVLAARGSGPQRWPGAE